MGIFRENRTTEYKTMRRAVAILFQEFPDIKDNVSQADQDAAPLIKKIRKVSSLLCTLHDYMRGYIEF